MRVKCSSTPLGEDGPAQVTITAVELISLAVTLVGREGTGACAKKKNHHMHSHMRTHSHAYYSCSRGCCLGLLYKLVSIA